MSPTLLAVPAAPTPPTASDPTAPTVSDAGLAAAGAALQARAREATLLLKALSNPDRLLLLCQLVDGERTVAALGTLTGIGQPSLSQQLAVLRAEGLVATRRDGKHIHYRIASAPALAVLQTLYQVYCAAPGDPR